MNRQIKKYNDEYITDISGSSKDGVIYIGDWYVFEKDSSTVFKAKICILILSLLSALLFGVAGFLDAQASFTAYVFMPYIITFLPIVYSVADGFKLISYDDKLTHKQYDKSVVNLKHTSIATIVLSILSLIGNIVMYIMAIGFDKFQIKNIYYDIIFTLCVAAILISNIFIFFVRKNLKCETIKNEN